MKRLHVVFKVLRVIGNQLNKEMNFLKDTMQRNVMKNINSSFSLKKKPSLKQKDGSFHLKVIKSVKLHAAKASRSSKCRIFYPFYLLKGICFSVLYLRQVVMDMIFPLCAVFDFFVC